MHWPTIFTKKTDLQPKAPDATDAAFRAKVARFREQHGLPERFVLSCACAKTDQPFRVIFERFHSNSAFRIAAIEKAEGSGGAAGAPAVKSLPAGDVSFANWLCPWCADKHYAVQCDRCRTTVCGGRVSVHAGQQHFICRASCGARGMLIDSTKIHGSEEQAPKRDFKRLPAAASHPRLTASGPDFLRLRGPNK